MRRRWTAVCAVALLATVAEAGLQAKRVHLAKPRHGFQVKMSPFVIPPNGERDVCEYRELPNAKEMDVQAMNLRMTNGAHHFVLWEYTGTSHDRSKFPQGVIEDPACLGAVEGESVFSTANLFGMQRPNELVRFPKGVAVRLAPHQQVFLNAHMRNFDLENPLTPKVLFNLIPAKKGTVQHHAESMIVGTIVGIHVPPQGKQTVVTEFTWPTDVHVVQLAPHQHKRGTHSEIHYTDSMGNTTRLVNNNDWEHAELFQPLDPVPMRAGEKLRLTCEWQNESDHVVSFGQTTNDEMCFILGYFYRDDESQPMPFTSQCLPQATGLLCPLAPVLAD